MEQYVGLDVSLTMTAICIVDRTVKIEREGVVASDPEAIAAFVRLHICAFGYLCDARSSLRLWKNASSTSRRKT
jgi:hypothetical protein